MRERIIPESKQWSPYPHGRVLEACRDIAREASFFMDGFGDEPKQPPKGSTAVFTESDAFGVPRTSRKGTLLARLDAEERRFIAEHRPDLLYAWPVGKPIDEQIAEIRAAHYACAKQFDDVTERMVAPKGSFVLLAKEDHTEFARAEEFRDEHRRTIAGMEQARVALEMGLAETEHVRVSEPVDLEVGRTYPVEPVSDGIPYPIGHDESTTPKQPPKGSTAVFTESEHAFGVPGMRW